MEKVYILEIEDLINNTARTFGVYSSEEMAESDIPDHDEDKFRYYITEVEVDVSFNKQFDIDNDSISDILSQLMEAGIVDQLVDENGNFVYVTTDKGD